MGNPASKVGLKSEKNLTKINNGRQNPESPQISTKKLLGSKKTELSPYFSQLKPSQSEGNLKNFVEPSRKTSSNKIYQSNLKPSKPTLVQPHKIQFKEQNTQEFKKEIIFQHSKSESFRSKSDQNKQNTLFKKCCSIFEISEQEGNDLNKIKKVYPKLAKKNRHDNQRLIQLNQAFLFLRISYFKTEFGTSAVYESDDIQIFQKRCDALNLSETDATKIHSLKNNFASIMTVHRLNKRKRIEISIAYEYLANCIFKVEKSSNQIKLVDAVIICDKETLIQMFTENKEFVNFRQKGSNYPLLYIAVRSGHYEIVELILRMGCKKDFEGERSTPLHCAAFYEHKQILTLLLSYGLPHSVKNANGYLPQEQASNEEVKKILKNVNIDEVQQLILSLTLKKICQGCININDNNGQVMARKILLSNYFEKYDDHVDAFHGTSFEALESIAKHGLKKPGTILDGKEIKVAPGHINEERLEIQEVEENQDKWSDAIFLSPSYNYACCPCYSKDLNTMNHINGYNDQWAVMIQAKLKKNSYKSHQSTTEEHEILPNEPFLLEYRVENSDNVTVVALILIRRQYMREKQNKNYLQTSEMIFNSKEETQFLYSSRPPSQEMLTKILENLHDSHFQKLIIYLTQKNLYKSKFHIYHENGTMMCQKILLQSGLQQKTNYVDAFHVTDYSSLWMLEKYGLNHLLNEKKQIFISPTIFEYTQITQLPKERLRNITTFQKEEWSVVLHIKVNKSVFLQSNRSQEFIQNWKDLSNIKFRIKHEILKDLDLKLCVVGIIFVNLQSISNYKKYEMVVNKMR